MNQKPSTLRKNEAFHLFVQVYVISCADAIQIGYNLRKADYEGSIKDSITRVRRKVRTLVMILYGVLRKLLGQKSFSSTVPFFFGARKM